MRPSRLPPLAAIAGVLCSACATSASASSAPAAFAQPAEDQAALELQDHHRHHNHGGVTQFIAMSLDTLGTNEAKRPRIEKLRSDLNACMAPARDIEGRLLLACAEGVAAGAIEAPKVEALIHQLTAAATDVRACSLDTLNRIHAILSPEEREALVDKVGAHWEVWRKTNQDAEATGGERGSWLASLNAEVNLSADQIEKMSAALRRAHAGQTLPFDPTKVEAHLAAFEVAFVAPTFDARLVVANADSHLATHGSQRMVTFYQTVTPLLTPAQRTKLSEDLREHSNPPPAVSAS